MAAANICDELVGTRAGVYERRYTANGVLSLAEGKIAITRASSPPPWPGHWS